MIRILTAALLAAFGTAAVAKLPPLDDAAKAKAAETAAKAAWQGKVDAYQLCKSQDQVAAKYRAKAGKPAATPVAAKPAAAASGAAAGTPVASAPPAPCVDPGPFAYTPPEQKPLEASGAHSPAANAGTPPSVRPEAAKMAPGGGGVPAAPAAPAAPAKKS
jgi:hypothetical protein